MNKVELVAKVAEQTGSTKKAAVGVVDAVIASIIEGMKADGVVKIAGFGTFSVKDVDARIARNPMTGEPVNVEAHKKPRFKAASALKEAVNA